MDTLEKNNNTLRIWSHSTDMFQAVATDFARRTQEVVAEKGKFSVVLSGGNTAKSFFDVIIASERRHAKIPWKKIQFFFGDERYVPADDPQSNYYTAKQHLFSQLSIPAENIYPIRTDLGEANICADFYQSTLRKLFKLKNNEFPKFDLVYLGLGENAHTASLMPGSAVLTDNNGRLVVSLWVAALNMYRITLTPAAINHSDCICFLVRGKNKALAVWQTLAGPRNPQLYPAQLIKKTDGKIIWYLDQAAASRLYKDSV